MRVLTFLFFSVLLCSHLNAQPVVVFKTFDDYKNNTGKEYEESTRWIFTNNSGSLVVRNGKEKSLIRWRDVWGFKIGPFLYRSYKGEAYRVVVPGPKLFYYDYGKTSIGPSWTMSYSSPTSFLSKTIDSPIVPVFRTHSAYNETKQIEKLKRKFPDPELEPFFDCLGTSVFGTLLVDCVTKFQKTE